MQAEHRYDRRRLWLLLPVLLWFAWMSYSTLRTHVLRDRWHRHDLADRYPAGGPNQSLLLVNAGTAPAFVAVRCAAWGEPRPELLLPGQSQMVVIPLSAGQQAEVRCSTLDTQAPDVVHIVPLPADWFRTSIDVDEDGAIRSYSKKGGDSSPRRGLVGVDSEYPLPIRVDLPFEPHWRLSGDAAERRAWIGPGTADDSDQCAYEIGPPVSVTLRVPRRPDVERVFAIESGDSPTRLTMKPDGTVERDTLPMWRQVAQLAGF